MIYPKNRRGQTTTISSPIKKVMAFTWGWEGNELNIKFQKNGEGIYTQNLKDSRKIDLKYKQKTNTLNKAIKV